MTLDYLSEEVDRHGNVRLYFRRRGKRIRLRKEVGTPEFIEEYNTALKRTEAAPVKSPIAVGTLRWLASEWFRSAEFRRLNPATQQMRRNQLEAILPKYGAGRVAMIAPKHVRSIRDEKSATPHAADNLLKTLRGLFSWAVEAEYMRSNPAREIGKIAPASEGHHTWTRDEIERFMTRHPGSTKAGLAIALLLYTGVRRSDVVKLGRQMETNGYLRLIETKGRARRIKVRELPILPQLRAVLQQHRTTNLTFLVTEKGKPFTVAGFGNWFRERCDEAALFHCSAHGLRKAGATMAADAGASTKQLQALFGWDNPAQAEDYTRKADQKRLASTAAKLIAEEEQKTDIGVSPCEMSIVSPIENKQ